MEKAASIIIMEKDDLSQKRAAMDAAMTTIVVATVAREADEGDPEFELVEEELGQKSTVGAGISVPLQRVIANILRVGFRSSKYTNIPLFDDLTTRSFESTMISLSPSEYLLHPEEPSGQIAGNGPLVYS